MRKSNIIFLLTTIVVLGFLVNAFSTLISLLFEDGQADAIQRSDIPAPGSELLENRTQIIPKIIHQTYINTTIPVRWQKGQQACIDLHKDYEYKLWTDELSREFIATEYPWFLSTFDAYPFPIQRADAIRYFVLAFYGGIYIDLDDGCNRRLDPLLSYPAWLRFTTPTGISNDAMGSIPQHPFFLKAIDSLAAYQRNWGMPYISVMYSTGPLFLSVIWKEYIRERRLGNDRVRILMPGDYRGSSWSFFNIETGNSWHGKDAQTIFWMGKHWMLVTVIGFAIGLSITGAIWVCCCLFVAKGKGGGGGVGGPRSPGKMGGRRGLFGWKRLSGSDKARYELVDRMA